jgi:ferredoxin
MGQPLKIVKELCIECGVCREVCPYTAVYLEPTRWRVSFIIDAQRCTGCGGPERAMCVRFCPTDGAIALDTEFVAAPRGSVTA